MIQDLNLATLSEVFIKHGVILAYLFGSQAEGRARSSSDVDIAVLLPWDTPRGRYAEARLSLVDDLMAALQTGKVDLVLLNEAPPLLMHQVAKHGRILYEDPDTRPAIDFVVRAAARYFDAAPTRHLARAYLEEWLDERAKVPATANPT